MESLNFMKQTVIESYLKEDTLLSSTVLDPHHLYQQSLRLKDLLSSPKRI